MRRRSKEHRELRGGLRLHLSCWGTDLHLEEHDKWQKIRRCTFGHNRDGKRGLKIQIKIKVKVSISKGRLYNTSWKEG